MPTISFFYGLVIRMYFNDHAPPHFHAEYAEFKATIDIHSLTLETGKLPDARKCWGSTGLNFIRLNCSQTGSCV
jgi:hypothetical protein